MNKMIIAIITFLLIIGFVCGAIAIDLHPSSISEVTITDKAIKRYGDNDKYLVFTDKGVFEVTDNLFIGRFDSSDFYGELKIGKTYDFKLRGYRVPILSMYQNIESFELKE